MADELDQISLLELENDTEEIAGYDPELDANAGIPPFPAGTYPCIVRLVQNEKDGTWWTKKIAKDGQVMYLFVISAELYGTPEGKYDGRRVTHYVNTYTSKFGATNSVQAVLQGVGKGEDVRVIGKARGPLAALMVKTLQGDGAPAEAEFDWEARYSVEEPAESGIWVEKFKRTGMKRFNLLPDGTYDPEAEYNGIPVMARNVLMRFVNPEKAKKGTQQAGVGQTVGQQMPQGVQTGQAPRTQGAQGAPQAPQAAPRAPQAPTPRPQPAMGQAAPQGGPPVPPRARK